MTDDRQTDRQTEGWATAYSKREGEFTFAKKRRNYTQKNPISSSGTTGKETKTGDKIPKFSEVETYM